MTGAEKLQDFIRSEFSAASVEARPLRYGMVFLDIHHKGQLFVVLWRPNDGFSLWTKQYDNPLDGYGEQPDEFYRSFPALRKRLLKLLHTETPRKRVRRPA